MSRLSIRFAEHLVVDGLDLEVSPGQAVGLIGGSGSGKTMTALAMLGLLPDGAQATGRITVDGTPVLDAPEPVLRRLWGRRVAYVGQDALAALNPLATVGRQLAIPLRTHRRLSGRALRDAAAVAVEQVELPASVLRAYPAQLSGGQRQRVAIALALACRPALLIADEPTSALDVTTQAGVLELLRALPTRPDGPVALLLISHDIAVVARVCARLAVMRQGRIVEQGDTAVLLNSPGHPYTAGLVAAARTLSTTVDAA